MMVRLKLLKAHTLERDVKCASLHPDGSTFVYGSNSELWARVCDFESGHEIGNVTFIVIL